MPDPSSLTNFLELPLEQQLTTIGLAAGLSLILALGLVVPIGYSRKSSRLRRQKLLAEAQTEYGVRKEEYIERYLSGTIPRYGLTGDDIHTILNYLNSNAKLVHPPKIEDDPRYPTNFVPRTYLFNGVNIYLGGLGENLKVMGRESDVDNLVLKLLNDVPCLSSKL